MMRYMESVTAVHIRAAYVFSASEKLCIDPRRLFIRFSAS